MCYNLLKGASGMKKGLYLFMCAFTCCSLTQAFHHLKEKLYYLNYTSGEKFRKAGKIL